MIHHRSLPNYLLRHERAEEGGTRWRKNHARTRAVPVLQNREKNFVRLTAGRPKRALPVPVPIKGAELSVSEVKPPQRALHHHR